MDVLWAQFWKAGISSWAWVELKENKNLRVENWEHLDTGLTLIVEQSRYHFDMMVQNMFGDFRNGLTTTQWKAVTPLWRNVASPQQVTGHQKSFAKLGTSQNATLLLLRPTQHCQVGSTLIAIFIFSHIPNAGNRASQYLVFKKASTTYTLV